MGSDVLIDLLRLNPSNKTCVIQWPFFMSLDLRVFQSFRNRFEET